MYDTYIDVSIVEAARVAQPEGIVQYLAYEPQVPDLWWGKDSCRRSNIRHHVHATENRGGDPGTSSEFDINDYGRNT